MKLFTDRLRKILVDNDLTQKDLANRIGVTEVTISRYLNGDRSPRIDVVNRIAREFNVTTDYLLGVTEGSNRERTNIHKVPEMFDDPIEARKYINNHLIFTSQFGIDTSKLDDEEILQFANETLDHMKMVGYKYQR